MDDNRKQKLFIVSKYFINKKSAIVFLICLVLIGTIINGVTPFLFGIIIDAMLKSDFASLLKNAVYMTILEMIGIIIATIEDYFGSTVTQSVSNEMKKDVLNHIICMKMSGLDCYSKGELINRLEGDTNEIAGTYIGFLTGILQVIINVGISIYFAVVLSKELTILAMGFMPILYLGTILFKKEYKMVKTKLKIFTDKYMGIINEVFSNFEGIKSFNYQENIIQKISAAYSDNLMLSKCLYRTQAKMGGTQKALNILFDMSGILCAAFLISCNKLTIGRYVSFNQYIRQLFQTASQVMSYVMNFASCDVNIDRINEVLNESSEDVKECLYAKEKINTIQIENLSFCYNNRKILDDFSLKIEHTGLYTIVGINGVGKTTVLKVLLGLYEWEKGTILINGEYFKKISLYEYRERVSYIPKQPFLFNETIKYNLTLGRPIDTERIDFVCRKVGLYEYIQSQENKYETIVGEGGGFLSSGTKQKISIARAALKDSSLWLCDEITSDLDGRVETDVMNYLKELSQTRIIVMISHKLSSVEKSDKIFVMTSGGIISEGTNSELIENEGLYREMFK
ncbi:ABC transporter ATP-binding protein [Butyrivibrio sp. AE2005]|uniref:ABC transporter ATP-binding protein n=1 Tax=Butyrivibrio sp. AE2005 TaxID=1496722 RepID=UPI00047C82F9|nr:ABC transporter ATP-binding protein [Butyrivibrio sp. AE2005]